MAVRQLTSSELSATGKVVLGMLAFGKHTGYEIKQFVDKSTRHFWAASYGQIYPELRRFAEQGFVGSRSEPSGRRARTVFELTEAGEQLLRSWLESTAEPLIELRHEGMLKLFFSDTGTAAKLDHVRSIRAGHERKLEQLRAVEPQARQAPDSGPYLTLSLGLQFNQCIVDWCLATERRLAGEER
jgi:PadR family transcriptional regulator AphA